MKENREVVFTEGGKKVLLPFRSALMTPPPRRVTCADDTQKADVAYRLACEGTGLLWRGDFHNARQLLNAMARRFDRKPQKKSEDPARAFHQYRMLQAQRSAILGKLLLQFEAGHVLNLKRAPDVRAACLEVYGESDVAYAASLRELQGLIGAHEWRKKGVEIRTLGARIHPHYGVFSPVRGEYLTLVAKAPLPKGAHHGGSAFDIGTGTGVIAAILAKRGVQHIIATDCADHALICAEDNITRLGLQGSITVQKADLFPPGKASLIVCNPPWLPGRPASLLERAVYDPDSRMLRTYLDGLANHLEEEGEGWLILSNLAELLGLRLRQDLINLFECAGLDVVDRMDIKPHHPRTQDTLDHLYMARSAEVTSLWRLAMKKHWR